MLWLIRPSRTLTLPMASVPSWHERQSFELPPGWSSEPWIALASSGEEVGVEGGGGVSGVGLVRELGVPERRDALRGTVRRVAEDAHLRLGVRLEGSRTGRRQVVLRIADIRDPIRENRRGDHEKQKKEGFTVHLLLPPPHAGPAPRAPCTFPPP